MNSAVIVSVLALCCLSAFALPEDFLKQVYAQQQLNEVSSNATNIWAVLVAGSNYYYNYRHQADVCHAYQILHQHGIPDERIIVLMYDDLAQDPENPTPGILINHPKGKDVYKGVVKDYTKEDVTPENFIKVLKGDEQGLKGVGSGKVLKSGPNDNVFVFFADHGAPGILGFPSSELSAKDLNDAITFMHKKNMYKKLVVYIEACESGSIFENILPNNINVFATTAANGEESSYACYYDEERGTYLGDVYSVNWMEDSDKENLQSETLQKQFQIVRKETNTSHVQEFGDLSIGKLHVSEFQGQKPAANVFIPPKVQMDVVPSPDVPLAILQQKLLRAKTPQQQQSLQKQIKKMIRNRVFLTNKVVGILTYATGGSNQAHLLNKRHQLKDFECYDEVRQYFNQECFSLSKNAYALRQLYTLVNMCEDKIPVVTIKEAMDEVCVHPPVFGII